MLSEKLTEVTDAVTAAIKETQEYKDYEEKKRQVRSDPKAAELIERARSLQKRLMEIPEEERNSDYAESLQNEYEEIAENTIVYDYSRAEAIYMTMIQEAFANIIENVEIDY